MIAVVGSGVAVPVACPPEGAHEAPETVRADVLRSRGSFAVAHAVGNLMVSPGSSHEVEVDPVQVTLSWPQPQGEHPRLSVGAV